jgi:hypothetical protein
MRIEPSIEARIGKMAAREMKAALKGVKLISAVKWDSIK